MSERDAFGPNLRRGRIQRGVSLERIAAATKISPELLTGLEQNDFSRWPTGIYARAYIRAYATAIGLDPETTVDDFCRWFPQGDRRAERVVRDHAELVGHELQWKDDLIGLVVEQDRRTTSNANSEPVHVVVKHARLIAAAVDLSAAVAAGLLVALVLPIGKATAIAVSALLYHAVTIATMGCTPAVWAIENYATSRHPTAGVGARPGQLTRRASDRVSPMHEQAS
jgi:transcriptional regulator with XRE-family HTH domain